MRLSLLHEQLYNNPYAAHVKKVMDNIVQGDSQLKEAIRNGLSYEQIYYAITHGKCVSIDPSRDRPGDKGDLGSTYLEQIIGNTIRDLAKAQQIHDREINFYRALFGMPQLDEKDPEKEAIKQFNRWKAAQQKIAGRMPYRAV